ncbi:MAG: glycosyltransferase family A protein [Bacteroidota bacterium]|nr:glycosyltransferase family A protein [Bacteroidota bacterium]
MEKWVSVVIPCYNHGAFIREALASIAPLESGLLEVIIVNDGSTDAFTIDVLRDLQNEGYWVVHQENQGLGKTRNNGIKLASGKYILPLDADNKLTPAYFEKGIQLLESNPNLSVVYGDPILFGDKEGLVPVRDFNLQQLITGNYIDACALFRKSAWEQVGGYDENMPYMGVEDWEFWLNLSFHGHKFYHLAEPSYYYRVANQSMIKKDTGPNFNELRFYIEKKHAYFLDFDAPADALSIKFKANPIVLLYKLILRTYFPAKYKVLVQQRKIKRI